MAAPLRFPFRVGVRQFPGVSPLASNAWNVPGNPSTPDPIGFALAPDIVPSTMPGGTGYLRAVRLAKRGAGIGNVF